MIYKRLTHITMTNDCIDSVKTNGVVKAYKANIYNREGGAYKIELNGKIVDQYPTMESAINGLLDLAIPNDLVIEGTGIHAGEEIRFLKRAVFLALAKKLEVVE